MGKRLQVILHDAEYREIQEMARSRRMSPTAWIRQAIDQARRHERKESANRKLAVIRKATRDTPPTGEIDKVLGEIEKASNES